MAGSMADALVTSNSAAECPSAPPPTPAAAAVQSLNVSNPFGFGKPRRGGGGAADDGAEGGFQTRWLYFGLFAWLQSSGRFMSLYYEDAGLADAEIGAVFAAGSFASPASTALVGVLADRLAQHRGPAARLWVFYGCVVWATLCFSMQTFSWFGASRFWVMLICRVGLDLTRTASVCLLDAITIEGLADRTRYGEERVFGTYSWAIMGLALGGLLDHSGPQVMHICKIASAVALGVMLWLAWRPLAQQQKQQREQQLNMAATPSVAEHGGPSHEASAREVGAHSGSLASVVALLKCYASSCSTMSFIFYAIVMAAGFALTENLLFIYFRELHASYFIDGVSIAVTVLFEIPLFTQGKRLLSLFGARGCLALTGLCYSARVVGLTFVPGGAWVLLFEPLHGVTYAFWQTGSVEVIASITPPALAAKGQTFLASARDLLGGTPGLYFGGLAIDTIGEAALYRSAAGLICLGLFVYLASTRRPSAAAAAGAAGAGGAA